MAFMGLGDVIIDDGVVTQLASLALYQNLQILEAGTGVISAVDREDQLRMGGQFIDMPRVADIQDLAQRKDTSDLSADVTPKKLEANLENKGVVRNLRIGPASLSELAAQIGVGSMDEFMSQLAQIIAKAATIDIKKWLYKGLAGAIPAIKLDHPGGTSSANRHVFDAYVDALTGQNLFTNQLGLNGMMMMGDAFSTVNTWLMHSKAAGDLFQDKIAEYKIDSVAGEFINGGVYALLGKTIIVDDDVYTELNGDPQASDLSAGSPTRYWTFLLGPAALQVGYQRDLLVRSNAANPDLGKEDVFIHLRGDMDFVGHVRNMQYIGAANPTDAEYVNPASWAEAYNDAREMLCVAVKHN